MTEGTPTTHSEPRGVLERGSSGDVVRRPAGALGQRVPTAATYDVVTEGLTGWRFVITKRWVGYIACAVAFAIICGFLSHWQLDRGKQAVAYNALVHSNFYSAPVPVGSALPTLTSYNSGQDWKRVQATGRYIASDQLFVRNRSVGSGEGFEVLTPLRLADGKVFVVDRGFVTAGNKDSNYPASEPRPPSGSVTVVARLEASEPKFGGIPSIKNQIESIDLTQVGQRVGGQVYTGAYGLLDSQVPATPSGLKRVVSSPPTVGEGLHWSYMIQWILFAMIGFFGLGYAIRTEFRRINADDPEERAREAARVRKRALKEFTDEESEDEILDGFIPLSRWGFGGNMVASAGRPGEGPAALSQVTHAIGADADANRSGITRQPEIYVLEPNDGTPRDETTSAPDLDDGEAVAARDEPIAPGDEAAAVATRDKAEAAASDQRKAASERQETPAAAQHAPREGEQ